MYLNITYSFLFCILFVVVGSGGCGDVLLLLLLLLGGGKKGIVRLVKMALQKKSVAY